MLAACIVLALPCAAAAASTSLHGLVLATEPGNDEVVVRHDAMGGMPGMTMTFGIASPAVMKRLQPGQTIDATADTSANPWILRDVRVIGSENLVAAQSTSAHGTSVIRDVHPLAEGNVVPNAAFVDAFGKAFSFSQLRGKNVVLAFIYTRCRDPRMCPLISSKFHRLQELLRGTNAHLVEISLDPTFDSPATLARYGRMFGADPRRWTLLTGDADRTLDFAAQFDVSALPDPHYGILHSERIAIIDSNGIIRLLIDNTSWSPDEIVAEIKSIDRQSSNPFLRFNLWLSAQAAAMCGDRAASFSGIGDLAVVALILGALGWLFYRLYRGIFDAKA